MPRFYTKTTKDEFMSKVKEAYDSDNQLYGYSEKLQKDLSKVNFDWENYTHYDEEFCFGDYPVGYEEIVPGFHICYINAGGDWEYPICFILYWSDGFRGYIPEDGNVYNKKEKCAYGSEENEEHDDLDFEKLDEEFSLEKMKADILQRIKLKES